MSLNWCARGPTPPRVPFRLAEAGLRQGVLAAEAVGHHLGVPTGALLPAGVLEAGRLRVVVRCRGVRSSEELGP
jgi:hypothetical protein